MRHRPLLLMIAAIFASTLLAQDQPPQQQPPQPTAPATVTIPSTLDGTVKDIQVKPPGSAPATQPQQITGP